jgi:hypothetical protein
MKVENYNLISTGGKHIRIATKVTFPSGRVVKFIEKLPKEEAIRQANLQIAIEQMQELNKVFN